MPNHINNRMVIEKVTTEFKLQFKLHASTLYF